MMVRLSLSRPAFILRAATRRPLLLVFTLLALVAATATPSVVSSTPLFIPSGAQWKLLATSLPHYHHNHPFEINCPPLDCNLVPVKIVPPDFPRPGCLSCPPLEFTSDLLQFVTVRDGVVWHDRIDISTSVPIVSGSDPDISSGYTRIAYVDVAGYLSTIGIDGSLSQRLSSLNGVVHGAWDATDSHIVFTRVANQAGLALSPDSSTPVSTRSTSGVSGELYVVQADGNGQSLLASNVLAGQAISWAPDSSAVVFASNRNGVANIYRVDLSDGLVSQLSFSGGENPRWSPDGSHIAFERGGELRVVRPDGSDERAVAQGRAAAWSPSGTMLAFLPSQSSVTGVFAVGLDGSSPIQLTGTGATSVSWVRE